MRAKPKAYYNEFDQKKAGWLSRLMRRGVIAPGDIDTRSIADVVPSDLRGYSQVHLFAGIGIWSYALRHLAGWPDDRPVWTCSCPCQPFSNAGKGLGFADKRHLWPAALHLIRAIRPVRVLGEQVASKDGLAWLDLVQADLEGEGYAFGAVDTCAAGFGAPHIRQRLYWVADSRVSGVRDREPGADADPARGAEGVGSERQRLRDDAGNDRGGCGGLALPHDAQRRTEGPGRHDSHGQDAGREESPGDAQGCGWAGGLVFPAGQGLQGREPGWPDRPGDEGQPAERDGANGRLGHTPSTGWKEQRQNVLWSGERSTAQRVEQRFGGGSVLACDGDPRPTHGFWRDADWLFCRDGKWRPVEPGAFPLAHGLAPGIRRLRLHGYGDGIVAPQAAAFIEACIEVLDIPDVEDSRQ